MWFIGMVAGAILGSLLGDRAIAGGAVLGLILGLVYKQRQTSGPDQGKPPSHTSQIMALERAVLELRTRIERLEAGSPPAPITTDTDVAQHAVSPGDTGRENQAEHQAARVSVPTHNAEKATSAPSLQTLQTAQTPQTSFAEKLSERAQTGVLSPSWWNSLVTGNLVAKAGVVILFFGVGFLLKYAYDHAFLPVPVRLGGVALFAAVMYVFGARLLSTRRLYAMILQGGSIGLLYLDVYFALKVFELIPPAAGFGLFMALGVAATLQAVRQSSPALAVLGLTGAFMAPVLAGSDSGNHVLLFSYYMLLNLFILAVSWFKSWRALNLVGFVFTFIVGLFWGWNNYRPELFASVEPFVIGFFVIYLAIPILFAHKQPPQLRGLVDGTLIFGTPLTATVMQAGLVHDMEYGLAWSTGCAAAVYLAMAVWLWRRPQMRVLAEAHAALAIVLGSLCIAFAFDAYPTFALWTLEGAALVWVGLRQQRLFMRLFGLLLQAGGAGLFLINYWTYDLSNPWFNDFVAGCALIAIASLATSGLMHRYQGVLIQGGKELGLGLLVWGVGWWFGGGLHVVHAAYSHAAGLSVFLMFAATSVLLAEWAGQKVAWPHLRRTHLILLLVMLVLLADLYFEHAHAFIETGWLAWPASFAIFYFTLRRQEAAGLATLPGFQHVAALWMVAFVLAWEFAWLFGRMDFGSSWSYSAWGLVPALLLGGICYGGFAMAWPFAAHAKHYRDYGLAGLALWSAIWALSAIGVAGDVFPFPYLPLLNVLDATQVAVLLSCGLWATVRREAGAADTAVLQLSIAGLAFFSLNAVILRTVHHFAGVYYSLPAMLDSMLAQAVLSLTWTVTALCLMVYATRTIQRAVWVAGALLLAIVVVKLFLLDMGNSGTVERIVTFLGVGVGLLAIGYLAPVPAGKKESVEG